MVKDSPLGRVTGTSLRRHLGIVKLNIDLPLDIEKFSDCELLTEELVPLETDELVPLFVEELVPEDMPSLVPLLVEVDVPLETELLVPLLVDV